MISDSKTTHHAIFTILVGKGFQVWYDVQTGDYWAEKQGWDFRASNFAALLGLVAIYEEVNPKEPDMFWFAPMENISIPTMKVKRLNRELP